MGDNFIKSKNMDIAPIVLQTQDTEPPQTAQAAESAPQSASATGQDTGNQPPSHDTASPEAISKATATFQAEIDRLNTELEKMRAAYREHDTMHQRVLADFDNYRRRVAIEKEVTTKLANEKLIKELLSTLDNYDRSLHLEVPPEARDFKVGMEIIYKNFMQVLKNNGLDGIDSDGAKFDPNLHEAVSHIDSDLPAETVVTTYQKGYLLGDRVLRHAIVVVSNGNGAAPATNNDNESLNAESGL